MLDHATQKETTVWFDFSMMRGPITGPLRTNVGLVVRVEADPAVEKFMQAIAAGEPFNTALVGNYWISLDSNPLMAYNIGKSRMPNSNGNGNYTMHNVGGALADGINPGDVVNLAFLRLVGISKPGGLSFGLVGAYSENYAREVSKMILSETKRFLHDYITPIYINLKLISQM